MRSLLFWTTVRIFLRRDVQTVKFANYVNTDCPSVESSAHSEPRLAEGCGPRGPSYAQHRRQDWGFLSTNPNASTASFGLIGQPKSPTIQPEIEKAGKRIRAAGNAADILAGGVKAFRRDINWVITSSPPASTR